MVFNEMYNQNMIHYKCLRVPEMPTVVMPEMVNQRIWWHLQTDPPAGASSGSIRRDLSHLIPVLMV